MAVQIIIDLHHQGAMVPTLDTTEETLPTQPDPPIEPARSAMNGHRSLTSWLPESPTFWESTGRRIAYRNLWISIPALFLAFTVWMVWSALVVNLPTIGFRFSTGQLFWLAAIPGLSGATLRIFYSFLIPIFGGRNWTVVSTASLLLPSLGMAWAVQHPETPYGIFVLLALLAGLGGGNFASSMANINFFFPKSKKGVALGLNAGLGQLGVSAVQFMVPLVIASELFGGFGGASQSRIVDGVTGRVWLQNASLFWVPFIVVVGIAAWFGMNNLETAQASFRDQSIIFRRKHTWVMTWLYLGTCGSFIGYSAAFPLLIRNQFPTVDPLAYAFLGPLAGGLARPLGGWLADRFGGGRVTLWNFAVMILGVLGTLYTLDRKGDDGSFGGFLSFFLLLFFASGIGNGSTFRMIPAIFRRERLRALTGQEATETPSTLHEAEREAGAVLGFSSAIAAYGVFVIPSAYSLSIDLTGGVQAALWGFILIYVSCIAITWHQYVRKGASVRC